MQVLQWALDHPDEIERGGARLRERAAERAEHRVLEAARAAIRRDAAGGMAVARMMAHITYLSEQGMELKFGRERRAEGPMTMDSDFEVEHYLDHQAEIFLARFDPLTYLYLSRVMDYFEPFAETTERAPDTRFLRRVLRQRLALWDRPLPPPHPRARRARRATCAAHEVSSPWGHDSFLMDLPEYHALVTAVPRREP